jgi:inner membrane protein
VPDVLLCVAALAVILVLDVALTARTWSVLPMGLMDEPAHLLTAGLVMAAVLPGSARTTVSWAFAAAVLIDLDHIPLYLWGLLSAEGSARPVTHSLATVAVLAGLALVCRGRWRMAFLGLALGVALHLVRDVATGPGIPLWWPVESQDLKLPYTVYATAMTVVTAIAAGRRLRAARDRMPR